MNATVYTQNYFLTAGECNAEGRMPLNLLIARLIEVATEHANSLGIGYAALIKLNLAWVLSRVSVEITRMPGINESYSLTTWIESTNRLFSERCFEITDDQSNILAMARTTWAAIDIASRKPSNPGAFGEVMFPSDPKACPVSPAPRLRDLPENAETEDYTFRYCDLDFNRHVNTVRYIDLILNHWGLEWFDSYDISRFDITFAHECHFGDTIQLRVSTDDRPLSQCELVLDGVRKVGAIIVWRPKRQQTRKQLTN